MVTKKEPQESEKTVDRYLVNTVTHYGGMCVKLAPTVAGVPDRLVILPGYGVCLVEVKGSSGRASEMQLVWKAKASQLGARVFIVVGTLGVDSLMVLAGMPMTHHRKGRKKE